MTAIHQAKVELADGKVAYIWTGNSGEGNAEATDLVLLIVFNKTHWMAVYDTSVALRSEKQAVLQLLGDWKDDVLAIYLGFRCEDGQTVANSYTWQYRIFPWEKRLKA